MSPCLFELFTVPSHLDAFSRSSLGGVGVFVHLWCWSIGHRGLKDLEGCFHQLPSPTSLDYLSSSTLPRWQVAFTMTLLIFLTLKDRRRGGGSAGQKKYSALEVPLPSPLPEWTRPALLLPAKGLGCMISSHYKDKLKQLQIQALLFDTDTSMVK